MAANTRMASAVQILCVLALKGPDGSTADIVARSLATNPVVVRRMLKALQRDGLVALKPGKDGGAKLARPADTITLDLVNRACSSDSSAFALRQAGNPNCAVDRRMADLLSPIFGAADRALESVLQRTTIQSLVERIA